MIWKGKIPREEGFLRGNHATEKGAWKFWGISYYTLFTEFTNAKKFPRRGEENGSIYIGDDLSY